MSWFLPAAIIASTGLQMLGQYQQGQQQKAAYDYNASLIEQKGAFDIAEIEKEQAGMTGAQMAAYARSNVLLKGSALDVMLNTASDYEYDKLVAKYNIEQQANLQRFYGKSAVNAARYKMGMSLLSGAIQMSDFRKVPTKPTTPTTPTTNTLETATI